MTSITHEPEQDIGLYNPKIDSPAIPKYPTLLRRLRRKAERFLENTHLNNRGLQVFFKSPERMEEMNSERGGIDGFYKRIFNILPSEDQHLLEFRNGQPIMEPLPTEEEEEKNRKLFDVSPASYYAWCGNRAAVMNILNKIGITD